MRRNDITFLKIGTFSCTARIAPFFTVIIKIDKYINNKYTYIYIY